MRNPFVPTINRNEEDLNLFVFRHSTDGNTNPKGLRIDAKSLMAKS
jgi:hypothetical protein